MTLEQLAAAMRAGTPPPRPLTNEQRLCVLFVKTAAEVPSIAQARPLSVQDMRVLSAWPDVTIYCALKGLVHKQCVARDRRGVYVLNPIAEWPGDLRGRTDGSREALKRNPRAAMPWGISPSRKNFVVKW